MLAAGTLDSVRLPDRDELVRRLRSQAWAQPLLEGLDATPGVHLVGGAVRDLLLGADPVDVDLTVEGDAPAVAAALADRLGGETRVHDRFGTATVRAGDLAFDLVSARAESYRRPGALPDVRPGTLDEDLARRDFSVNAIALDLAPARIGELHAAPGALEDLVAGTIRVLHAASFRDDPTRLLRAVRYSTRLGFGIEPDTERLAREAAGEGALDRVSGQRVADELLDLLREPPALQSAARLADLGIAERLGPGLRLDAGVAERALGLAPPDARRELLLLGAACSHVPSADLRAWLDDLGLEAADREAVVAAARANELAAALRGATSASEVAACADGRPPEAVALAGALGAEEAARRWLQELREVGLEIGGDDLLAAGVPPGPAVGRGLAAALARKRDGEVSGRDAELAVALAAAREG